MQSGGLSERYVTALSSIGLEGRLTLKKLQEEISAFATMYEASTEVHMLLENPAITSVQRLEVLGHLCKHLKLSKVAKNFLSLLTEKKRTRLLPEIAQGLERKTDEQAGQVRAHVRCAVKLTKKEEESLNKTLTKLQGQAVRMESLVDPTLIGGVVVEMGGKVYDGSLKKQLSTIRELILRESR